MSQRHAGRRAAGGAAGVLERLPPPDLCVETVELEGETRVLFTFPARPDATSSLTEAEQEVTELILLGLTTAQIATMRGVARATVSSQLQSIDRKLGVASRAELACKLG
jgi:DNA-binding CsgD family transcriptional regulator